jgi:L-arabinose isomerase
MNDGYGFEQKVTGKRGIGKSYEDNGHRASGWKSFMEDYTYHFEPGNQMVLGSHMLEICSRSRTAIFLARYMPLVLGKS